MPTSVYTHTSRCLVACILAGYAALGSGTATAQPWTDLGSHRVGFRVIETSDPARTFFGLTDGPVALHPKPPRPLQIHVWYPARPAAGAPPMHHRDYWALAERLGGVSAPTAERQAVVRGELGRMLRYVAQGEVSEAEIAAYLDRERPVFWNAPPEPGRFPLVLSQPARFDAAISEHLASHGYLVASVDVLGAGSVTLDTSTASLEAVVGDLEHLLAVMRADPQADPGRAASVQFSLTAAPVLLMQMRGQHLDAMANLDGWDGSAPGVAFLEAEPLFDPRAVRVPYLRLYGPDDALNATRTEKVFEACRYAERWRVTYPGIGHGDFSDDPIGSPDAIARRRIAVRSMARQVTAFLDATLKGDRAAGVALVQGPEAAGFPAGSFTVEHFAPLPTPPTERELQRLIRLPGGITQARTRIAAARAADPGVRLASEAALNTLGYELLADSRPLEAIEVFRTNVELYPDSANVYDSLGEALEGQKLYREAAASYGQAAVVARRQGDPHAAQLEANHARAVALATR